MKPIQKILLVLPMLMAICSCSTVDIQNQSGQNEYLNFYQKSYAALKNKFTGTRAENFELLAVTEEEIDNINNLETLMSYDQKRLDEIEESVVYQLKYNRGIVSMEGSRKSFLNLYSEVELNYLNDFVYNYIKSGSHNMQMLQSALTNKENNAIKDYLVMCAAVVDAYGDVPIWIDFCRQTTTVEDAIALCDEQMITAVSLVLVNVGITLVADVILPASAIFTALATFDQICTLVKIHNEWVACRKRAHK